jgi:carbonic anhydrase
MHTKLTYCTVDNLNPDVALNRLKAGNERYVLEHVEHPHEGAQHRVELSRNQHPFAVVLGCADSRVIPELIFDQGVGDLFVIRVAGNVADDAVLASIEYAIEHLGTRLIVVLGHENCGAVAAAVNHEISEGKINSLTCYIEPALNCAPIHSEDILTNTIKTHIQNTVERIEKTEPILAHECKQGVLSIRPAYYHLATGQVNFM